VDAVDHVRAPHAGLIIHKVDLGDEVHEGQVVAEIVRPEAEIGAPRTQLRARTSGVVFGRLFSRLARPGTVYLSIAGQDPPRCVTAWETLTREGSHRRQAGDAWSRHHSATWAWVANQQPPRAFM
jgi:hypothetical protein